VLCGLDLEILTTDMVAIVGESGCGKTVLLDLLTGLLEPDSGRVFVADHSRPDAPLVELGRLDQDGLDRIRLNWSVVFQRNALFGGTVYDNVALWLIEHTDLSEHEIRRRVRVSLERAALDPDDVWSKDRHELSGGMAKRVAIARAIATDPAVIFYDEPTTGLDPVVGSQIHELIREIHAVPRADGLPRTSVIITHDQELLCRLRPRIILLADGTICFDGTYEQFRVAKGSCAARYLRAMDALQTRPPPNPDDG